MRKYAHQRSAIHTNLANDIHALKNSAKYNMAVVQPASDDGADELDWSYKWQFCRLCSTHELRTFTIMLAVDSASNRVCLPLVSFPALAIDKVPGPVCLSLLEGSE